MKARPGGGTPVAEEAVLDVVGVEGLFEEGVVLEVDHAEGEVVAGGPEGMGLRSSSGLRGAPPMVERAGP